MQGLSSRAHAFSVEALVGKTIKRMKRENGKDSSSPGDTETETSSVRQETYEHGRSTLTRAHLSVLHTHYSATNLNKKSFFYKTENVYNNVKIKTVQCIGVMSLLLLRSTVQVVK